jgi:hypothetical protein
MLALDAEPGITAGRCVRSRRSGSQYMHRAIETSVPTAALRVPVLGPVIASLFLGQFPVTVFLMLSGFCLYYPYVLRNPA